MKDNNYIIKLKNEKINLYLLQNNVCYRINKENIYNIKKENNFYLENEKDFYKKNKKYIKDLLYYIKEYKLFNKKKLIKYVKYKHINENLKKYTDYYEENKENDNKNNNDDYDNSDDNYDENESLNESYNFKSDFDISDSYKDVKNWYYCIFNSLDINIYINPSKFKLSNKNCIKKLQKKIKNNFKEIYYDYYSLDDNGYTFYSINTCILKALTCNRIDLLKNKMKNIKFICKLDNLKVNTYLKDYLSIDNDSDIYVIYKYNELFNVDYYIDEYNFNDYKKVKEFLKTKLKIIKYNNEIKEKISYNKNENIIKHVSLPKRNISILFLNNKYNIKNLCFLNENQYLQNKTENINILYKDKIQNIIKKSENTLLIDDNIYNNFFFIKELIYYSEPSIIYFNQNKKYKKKILNDYEFIYKKIQTYVCNNENFKKKKKKIFLYMNKDINYIPSYYLNGFSYIGEDYSFYENGNYYEYSHKNILFIYSIAYNCYFISRKNEPLCLELNRKGRFFYYTFDYRKNEIEKKEKKIKYNKLNKIYSLVYNYIDNIILAGSKNCIFIFDLNNPIYKNKIFLLNEKKQKIGKITYICLLHSLEKKEEKENEKEDKKKEKEKKEENEDEKKKLKKNSNISNINKLKNIFLKNINKKIIKKYLNNYNNNKIILFIGTNYGIIYMYNIINDISNINEIICIKSFSMMTSIIKIAYYNKSILASSINNVYIYLFKIKKYLNNCIENVKKKKKDKHIKFYRENRDNQKYYFDVIKDFLFTGDIYGYILIYNLKTNNLIFKKKIAYAPIICLSVNKLLPLILIATSYNYSHFITNYIYKENKKHIIYKYYKYKNDLSKESNKPMYITSMNLYFIYELLNIYK